MTEAGLGKAGLSEAGRTETGSTGRSEPVYDGISNKLSELRDMILQKGEEERERILEEARQKAETWLEEQTARLDATVAGIESEAARRAQEVTTRQMIEAGSARDRDALRLQSELIREALARLRDELTAFSDRPDYGKILMGMAVEACAEFPKSRGVKLRLRAEDASYGPELADALKARFPELDLVFDPEAAPISGGVFFVSARENWRVTADWKSLVEEATDTVAKAVLAEL